MGRIAIHCAERYLELTAWQVEEISLRMEEEGRDFEARYKEMLVVLLMGTPSKANQRRVRQLLGEVPLAELLPHASFKIFDVNLRPPHYQLAYLRDMMQQADFIKLNDDELYELSAAFGSPYHSLEQNLRYLAGHTDTAHICITLGQHGAVYFRHGKILAHHGFRVSMADSVGAGDSFLAGFLFQMLSGASPEDTLAFACAIGALNVTRHGAVPDISLAEIQALMHPE